MKRGGRSGSRLTAEMRQKCRKALQILEGTGIEIEEAAKIALTARGLVTAESITFVDAVERFLDDFQNKLRQGKRRESTYISYEKKLAIMADKWGDFDLTNSTRSQIKQLLLDLGDSQAETHAKWRVLRALLNFGYSQDPPWTPVNLTDGLIIETPERPEEICFCDVDSVQAIFDNAGKHLPAVTLLFFAGIRPHELSSEDKPWIQWKHIDFDSKVVRIPSAISKVRKSARVIQGLEPGFWEILEPYKKMKKTDTVANIVPNRLRDYLKKWGGYGPDKPWPHDGARHSFATYHVSLKQDAKSTQLILGHQRGSNVLFTNYMGLATKAEAERYFAIRPEK